VSFVWQASLPSAQSPNCFVGMAVRLCVVLSVRKFNYSFRQKCSIVQSSGLSFHQTAAYRLYYCLIPLRYPNPSNTSSLDNVNRSVILCVLRGREKVLSRGRGFVTNNNGFWIEWLDLLTPFPISLNQLRQLTINDCLRLAQFWLDYECLPV
jgi:hypothetical protein